MVLANKNIKNRFENYIEFQDAQKLFASYSPLKTDDDLVKELGYILGNNTKSLLAEYSPRQLCNDIVSKHYPNETSVKSAFTNEILMKTKNHISVFELSVGSSRADICKINGTSIAYEIKTDLDNLQRLNKQLTDYLQVFEKVYVICSEGKAEKIKEYMPLECGIYIYRITKYGKYKFEILKSADFSKNINSKKQLHILTKQELSWNFNIDKALTKDKQLEQIIKEYGSEKINEIFKICMKQKYKEKWNFLRERHKEIYDIDYQWFFKYTIEPNIIYK